MKQPENVKMFKITMNITSETLPYAELRAILDACQKFQLDFFPFLEDSNVYIQEKDK